AGQGRAPFVDVRDIAAVAAATLTEAGHEGKAYEITGGQSLSYADIAGTFSRVLGRPVRYVDIPLDAAKKAMLDAGLPEWAADAINQLSIGLKEGAFDKVSHTVRDIAKKDPIPLEQFIRDNQQMF